jgi:hypothetical protein
VFEDDLPWMMDDGKCSNQGGIQSKIFNSFMNQDSDSDESDGFIKPQAKSSVVGKKELEKIVEEKKSSKIQDEN